jgi:hypothetical protein
MYIPVSKNKENAPKENICGEDKSRAVHDKFGA